MESLLKNRVQEHLDLFNRLAGLSGVVSQAVGRISAARSSAHKVMLRGNGGSASDSEHLAAEFTRRLAKPRLRPTFG
jgi:D-sedoheptulose 7-phosphate isomerase